jgi:hypothetical protein
MAMALALAEISWAVRKNTKSLSKAAALGVGRGVRAKALSISARGKLTPTNSP